MTDRRKKSLIELASVLPISTVLPQIDDDNNHNKRNESYFMVNFIYLLQQLTNKWLPTFEQRVARCFMRFLALLRAKIHNQTVFDTLWKREKSDNMQISVLLSTQLRGIR